MSASINKSESSSSATKEDKKKKKRKSKDPDVKSLPLLSNSESSLSGERLSPFCHELCCSILRFSDLILFFFSSRFDLHG